MRESSAADCVQELELDSYLGIPLETGIALVRKPYIVGYHFEGEEGTTIQHQEPAGSVLKSAADELISDRCAATADTWEPVSYRDRTKKTPHKRVPAIRTLTIPLL